MKKTILSAAVIYTTAIALVTVSRHTVACGILAAATTLLEAWLFYGVASRLDSATTETKIFFLAGSLYSMFLPLLVLIAVR